MIPQFDTALTEASFEVIQQPSKTYRDRTENISGYVDNKEAVQQTISHILQKERYAYVIYPNNFGMEFEKYIGQPFEYLQATIENDLRSALTQDDRIVEIKVTNIQKLGIDMALVEFDAYTTEGVLENMGVKIGF